jgi:hypothetical protein
LIKLGAKAKPDTMSECDDLEPNPALKSLNRLLGAWIVTGEAYGQVTFNWMEGGFFMVQDIDLIGTKGIEFIGYDKDSKSLKSHYFDTNGQVLEFTYEINESGHNVFIDMPGIKGKFKGKFSNGGETITGKWKWVKDGKQIACEVILTRIE